MVEKVITKELRRAICGYQKGSPKGCKGCPFLEKKELCVQPPRQQPSTTLLEGR